MRSYAVGLLPLFLVATAAAPAADRARPEPIPIWPGVAPGEKGDLAAEKEDHGKDNIIRVANVSKPTISVYRPDKDKDTGAAVVICPGGGYHILAWDLEGTEIARWFNSIGVTGIVLKYRVPARPNRTRHEPPLQDAQRALGLVRYRAKEWGIDPKRIGVLGFSAGGHLAATLSTNHDKRTYEPVDDADRESCRPDFTLLIYPAYLVGKDNNKLSPELRVGADTPRTFTIITQDDPVRAGGALIYDLALINAKVPSELHVFPMGGHGYGLRRSKNDVSSWPKLAESWMRSNGYVGQK